MKGRKREKVIFTKYRICFSQVFTFLILTISAPGVQLTLDNDNLTVDTVGFFSVERSLLRKLVRLYMIFFVSNQFIMSMNFFSSV